MTSTFHDGLEAAAALIEAHEINMLTTARDLAVLIRAIPDPAGAVTVVTDLAEAIMEFRRIWITIGGARQPKSIHGKGWDASDRKFIELVRKRKHDASAILTGTRGYAATNPESRFVPAPEVFLNKEWFMKDWARMAPEPPRNPKGLAGLSNTVDRMRDELWDANSPTHV